MNASTADTTSSDAARRIEELGTIILAYSEVTDKLQQSHERLEQTVRALRGELSEKNRMLERRKRLAALGEMAAGMAHEIRNPLGGIQLYASLLARESEDRPASLDLARKISGGVRRLEGLVSQVLQFTREMVAHAAPMCLAEVLDETIGLAAQALQSRNVTVEVIGPRPMNIDADPLLIGQALLNLVLNAAEAMEQAGSIRIEYGPPEKQKEARQFWLIIDDQGPGIAPQVMDRIFNPFFSTRETGTGLGLAIVHRIVEAHDGAISASNRQPSGARFEIRV